MDMNKIIGRNILEQLKKQNKKQIELANALGTSKQIISKMLMGSRTISAVELASIAKFLGVEMSALVKLPAVTNEFNVVRAFMGRVESNSAQRALSIADDISDMILFHAKVRANGNEMNEPWEE